MTGRSRSMGLFFAVLVVAAVSASTVQPAAGAPAGSPDSAAGTGAAVAPKPSNEAAAPQAPVRISADAAEYLNQDGLIIFTGNVVAVQADTTITADRMEVSFEKGAETGGKPAAAGIGTPAAAQRITKIVAEKKVSLRQVDAETGKERYATGEKGVYDVDQRVVTMSGNPRLWEGKNVIVGDEMVFQLGDKKVSVKGKVNLTVFPDDLKEEKKR